MEEKNKEGIGKQTVKGITCLILVVGIVVLILGLLATLDAFVTAGIMCGILVFLGFLPLYVLILVISAICIYITEKM